jgi:hypothetical protein
LQTNHAAQHGTNHHKADQTPKIGEPKHTLRDWTAQASMRILELENRCTGNRTVGSNPTLSAHDFSICKVLLGKS